MQSLREDFDIEDFFAGVGRAEARLLLLDYDGTLAPFHVNPARAVPYPGVVSSLDEMMAEGHTRLVIVTGRWTAHLLGLLRLKRRPEIWGAHGWERLMPDGDYRLTPLSPAALTTLVVADEWTDDIEALGARAERKPASIAFHWRGLSEDRIAAIHDELWRRWTEARRPQALAWREFDGGIELRASGCDKGSVVRALLAECGSRAAVAYLGDDVTDEDAFRAIPKGGVAALVREEPRPTKANLWLRPPQELLEFLRRWRDAARRG